MPFMLIESALHKLDRPEPTLRGNKHTWNRPSIYLTPSGYNKVGGVMLTQSGASLALGYYIQPFQG